MRLYPAYIFSLASLLGGISLSLLYADWGWFSRAGSLVVVAGILLTSSQILEQLHAMRDRRRYGEGWSQHDWAKETDTQSRMRNNGDDSEHAHSHGFYLLVAGTLIWGFGDLLGAFFQA